MKIDLRTEYRGREVTGAEAEHLRLRAGFGVQAAALLERLELDDRPIDSADADWLRRIMRAVEARIVEAVWTLARLPGDRGPGWASRHGVDYLPEFWDVFGNARDAGGKWEQPAPRPPKPSSKAIDAMHEPLGWLMPRDVGGLLAPDLRDLVLAAAATKRGDWAANVSWASVVAAMPELTECRVRTLQRRYEDGIRGIVAALATRGEG